MQKNLILAAVLFVLGVAASVVPVPTVRIIWCSGAGNPAGTLTEIWSCTNLAPPQVWTLAATVSGNFYYAPNNKPWEFFKLRARDPNTGAVSDWGTNQPCP